MLSSLVLIVVPLVMTSFLSMYFIKNEAAFSAMSTPEWLAFALLGILSQAFALTPPTFCALVLGYFWGWRTLPMLFLINMASIYLVYKLVKLVDHERFVGFISQNPKASKLMNSIKKDELKIIALAKLSPILPFTFTNFIFALSGAKLRNILLGGFLGMIPRTVMSVWAGAQAKEIRRLLEDPNRDNSQQIVLIALIVISAFGLIWVINRAVKRA